MPPMFTGTILVGSSGKKFLAAGGQLHSIPDQETAVPLGRKRFGNLLDQNAVFKKLQAAPIGSVDASSAEPKAFLSESTMQAVIRQVKSEDELQKVFCLRYQVYVKELGLEIAEADHKNRMIKGSLDEHATILGSFIGHELIGTVAVNFACKDLGAFIGFHEMEAFRPFFPERSSMTTKLLVKPEYRRGRTVMELLKAAYKIVSQGGSLFDHICFHPRQRSLFEHLGYRQILPQLNLPGYGMSYRMVLLVRDRVHFSEIRSPFRRLVPQGDDCGTVQWFRQNFRILPSSGFKRCRDKHLPSASGAQLSESDRISSGTGGTGRITSRGF